MSIKLVWIRTVLATLVCFILATTAPAQAQEHGDSCLNIPPRESVDTGGREQNAQERTDRRERRREELERQIRESQEGNILVHDPEELGIIRRITHQNDANRLVLMNRSTETRHDVPGLTRPLQSVHLYHATPATESAAVAIHGSAASGIDREYLASLRSALGSIQHSTGAAVTDLQSLRHDGVTMAATLYQSIVSGRRDELALVIGHVDHGAVRFPDGSSLLVSDISSLDCGCRVWVVGCNTLTQVRPPQSDVVMGTGRRITYNEAIGLSGDIARQFQTQARGTQAGHRTAATPQGRPADAAPPTQRSILLNIQNNSRRNFGIGVVGSVVILQAETRMA